MKFYLLLLAYALFQKTFAEIEIISEFDGEFELNGNITKRQNVFMECDSENTNGNLDFLNYVADVTCYPRETRMIRTEVCRIPSYMTNHVYAACLVEDPNSFNLSLVENQITGLFEHDLGRRLLSHEIAGIRRGLRASLKSAITRKLLDSGTCAGLEAGGFGVCDFSSIGAWFEGLSDLDELPNALAEINTIDANVVTFESQTVADFTLLSAFAKNTVAWINNTNQDLATLQTENDLTNHKLDLALLSVGLLENVTTVLANAMTNLTENVALNFTYFDEFIHNRTQQLQNEISTLENRTTAEFLQIYGVLKVLSNTIASDSEAQYLLAGQQQLIQQNMLSSIYDIQTNVQLRRMLSPQFFIELSNVPPEEIAMVSNNYIIPKSDTLHPELKRVVFDDFIVNVIEDRSHAPHLKSYRISFYADRDSAFSFSMPGLNLLQIIVAASTGNCSRSVVVNPVTQAIGTEDTSYTGKPVCRIWIEVQTTSCFLNTSISGFQWRNAEPGKSSADQDGKIKPQYCSSSVSRSAVQVFRNFADFVDYYKKVICTTSFYATANHEFQVLLLLLTRTAYVKQSLPLCPRTLQSALQADLGFDLLSLMLAEIQVISPIFRKLVLQREVEHFGREASRGVQTDVVEIQATPTRYDSNNQPIIDASSLAHKCAYSKFISLSRTTVPMYYLASLPGNSDSELITIDTVTVKDPQFTPDYPQQEITQKIFSTSTGTRGLPFSLLVVGDIGDEIIYDTPEQVTSNVNALPGRSYDKISYFRMPPGTMNTFGIDDWINQNGQFYSPDASGISLDQFAVLSLSGLDGFPYCDTEGGFPVQLGNGQSVIIQGEQTDGRLCMLLKHYQVYEETRDGVFYWVFRHRVWKYLALFTLPSGSYIINNLGNTDCTQSSLVSLGVGGLQLELDNSGQVPVQQRVQVIDSLSSSVYNSTCTLDETVTVEPGIPLILNIDRCNDITITVSALAGFDEFSLPVYETCKTYTPSNVNASVFIYGGIQKDVNITIITAFDEVTEQISTTESEIYQAMLSAGRAIAQSTSKSEEISGRIDDLEANVTSNIETGFQWLQNDTISSDSMVQIFETIAETQQNDSANFAANLVVIAAIDANLTADREANEARFSQQDTELQTLINITAQLVIAINKTSGDVLVPGEIFDPDQLAFLANLGLGSGIGDIIHGIGTIADDAAKEAEKLGKDAIDDFEGLGSWLEGAFSNLLSSPFKAIAFIVISLACVCAFGAGIYGMVMCSRASSAASGVAAKASAAVSGLPTYRRVYENHPNWETLKSQDETSLTNEERQEGETDL